MPVEGFMTFVTFGTLAAQRRASASRFLCRHKQAFTSEAEAGDVSHAVERGQDCAQHDQERVALGAAVAARVRERHPRPSEWNSQVFCHRRVIDGVRHAEGGGYSSTVTLRLVVGRGSDGSGKAAALAALGSAAAIRASVPAMRPKNPAASRATREIERMAGRGAMRGGLCTQAGARCKRKLTKVDRR